MLHFTHIEHLADVSDRGLLCDSQAQARGILIKEVGNRGIKERRRVRVVPVHPGGVVADYVPFYYAPRSPMMFSIHHGNVPEYTEGISSLAYLTTTVERLLDVDCDIVVTDRNAVLGFTAFHSGTDTLDDVVDWKLMKAKMWNDTIEEPDRMERRMAECLVHDHVPWTAFTAIHVTFGNPKGPGRGSSWRKAYGDPSACHT